MGGGRWLLLSCAVAAAFAATETRAAETVIPLSGEVPSDGLDHFRVPFDVPAGTVEIEVRHSDGSQLNILDWGLDDPNGFRGWGGGNTEPAIVGVDAASRSYVPGPIPAGEWAVVVGKAKIDDPPGAYDIEVVLRDSDPVLAPQMERSPYEPAAPLRAEPGWYAGDFHVHSNESGDASATFADATALAAERGLDFIVISDHNVHTNLDFFESAQAQSPGVLLVPGVEFTTYAGHANGIGATSWVDHKIGQPGVTIEAAVEAYHEQGAVFAINHPGLEIGDACIGCAWEHELDPAMIDAVEIAAGGLEPFGMAFTPGAIEFWDSLCEQGFHIAPIGGSDDHKAGIDLNQFQSPIGDATTLVYATELSAEAIVEGVRSGRTVVKLQGPGDPTVEWDSPQLSQGDAIASASPTLVARVSGGGAGAVQLWKNGAVMEERSVDSDPFEVEWTVQAPAQGEDRYRVEVLVDGRRRVVTSHLWVRDGPEPSGTTTGADGGSGGSGGTTGATVGESGDDGGCGCRTTDSTSWALWLLAIVAVRRRPLA